MTLVSEQKCYLAPVAQSVSALYLYDSIESKRCGGCEFEPHLGQKIFFDKFFCSLESSLNIIHYYILGNLILEFTLDTSYKHK